MHSRVVAPVVVLDLAALRGHAISLHRLLGTHRRIRRLLDGQCVLLGERSRAVFLGGSDQSGQLTETVQALGSAGIVVPDELFHPAYGLRGRALFLALPRLFFAFFGGCLLRYRLFVQTRRALGSLACPR